MIVISLFDDKFNNIILLGIHYKIIFFLELLISHDFISYLKP